MLKKSQLVALIIIVAFGLVAWKFNQLINQLLVDFLYQEAISLLIITAELVLLGFLISSNKFWVGGTKPELINSTNRSYQAVENSPTPIFSVDQRGNILSWNPACEVFFQYDQEVIGNNFQKILWEDDSHATLIELLKSVFTKQLTFSNVEISFRSKDGKKVQTVSRIFPIHNIDNEVEECIFINNDLTQLKEAERAFRDAQEQLRFVVDHAPDDILMVDREGKILFINHPPDGMTISDAFGTTLFDYVTEDQHEKIADAIECVILTGKPDQYETVSPGTDGQPRWFSTKLGPIRQNSENLAVTMITRDITDRKRAESLLRESEKKYRILVEHANDAIIVVQDGVLKFANPKMEKLTGYSRSELATKPFVELIHEDDRKVVLDRHLRRLNGEEFPGIYSFRIVDKDGNTRWAEISAVLIDWDGKLATLSFLTDVTERERAAESFRASEERFHLLFNEMLNGFALHEIVCDDEGNPIDYVFLEMNAAFENMTGLCAKELIGKTVRETLPGTEEQWIEKYGKVAITGESIRFEEYSQDLGKYFEVSTFSPKPGQFATIIMDVTERKKATKIILQQQEELNTILDSVPALIFYKDKEDRFIRVNKALAQAFNMSVEEMIGITAAELSPAKEYWEDDKRVMETGIPLRNIIEPMHTPEGTKWAQTDKIPYKDPDGNIVGIIGLAVDITERKRIEEELFDTNRRLEETLTTLRFAQEQALEQERLAAVGQLAAGIAHDFNNILVSITLYTQMLLLDKDIVALSGNRLEIILSQAKRASSLTDQLLDFSRQAVMDQQSLDMIPFLEEFTELLRRTLPESIKIDLSYGKDAYSLYADPARMQQVFMNLALNARDALPDGGILRFELSKLHVFPGEKGPLAEMPPKEWVHIKVIDSGTGIEPDDLSHIFEPFFTTKEPGSGTGLGLAQVYGIVKQHEGYIDVESEPGKGTTFVIYLPTIDKHMKGEPTKIFKTPLQGSGETILIVEDNEATKVAINDILVLLNYRVLSACSGGEALKVYERENIDLVLSDMIMPGLGGDDLYDSLIEIDPEVKMVVMSGYPFDEKGRTLIEQGQLTWLKKPLGIEGIASTLRSVLGDH